MLAEPQKERLALARRLRETADRSEQELRDALSRSYYSIYHVARAWVGPATGKLGHGRLRARVQGKDAQLAQTMRELYRFRERADYDPEMVVREYDGDLERFRLAVNRELERARAVYDLICEKIARESAGGL